MGCSGRNTVVVGGAVDGKALMTMTFLLNSLWCFQSSDPWMWKMSLSGMMFGNDEVVYFALACFDDELDHNPDSHNGK